MSDSNTNSVPAVQLPPIPGNKTVLILVSGVLVTVVPQIAKYFGWSIPALDQNQIQEWMGVVLALGLLAHRYGLNTVGQYILIQVGPVLGPIIRDEIMKAVPHITDQIAQTQARATPFMSIPALNVSAVDMNEVSVNPNADLSPFADVLSKLNLQPTATPSPQAFTLNGHAYEPADLLRALQKTPTS